MTTPDLNHFPDQWNAPGSVLKGAEIGYNVRTLASVHAPTYQHNTVIWGQRGSGTSNMLRLFLANLITDDDAVIWMIDPEGQHAGEYLKPMIDGGPEQPPFDWVATTWSEAVQLAHAAAEIATARKAQLDQLRRTGSLVPVYDLAWGTMPTQVIVVVASGASALALEGNSMPAHAEATRVRADLLTVAKAGTRVDRDGGEPVNTNLVLQLKRLSGLGEFRAYITNYVAMNGADESDLTAAFGKRVTGDPGWFDTNDRYDALMGNGTGSLTRVRPYYLTTDRIAEIVRASDGRRRTLPDDEADEITGGYLGRWNRALKILFGDQDIPGRLVGLGLPTIPTDLSTATRRQIEHALSHSPSAGSEGAEAAAEILVHGAGHQLLTNEMVLACMVVEDGTLYVRWPMLRQVAADCETGHFKAPKHPDAGILLRLIAHLATGGLTDASSILISTALDLTNNDAPADNAGEGE